MEEKRLTFRKLLEKLNEVAELRPDTLDFDVIVAINSSMDCEGCEDLEEIDIDDNMQQLWLTGYYR